MKHSFQERREIWTKFLVFVKKSGEKKNLAIFILFYFPQTLLTGSINHNLVCSLIVTCIYLSNNLHVLSAKEALKSRRLNSPTVLAFLQISSKTKR